MVVSVLIVYLCDLLADWFAAQDHGLSCLTLAREKIKSQSIVSAECILLLHLH